MPPASPKNVRERALLAGDPRLVVTFAVAVPANFSEAEVEQHLQAQGYTRIHRRTEMAAAAGATVAPRSGKKAGKSKAGAARRGPATASAAVAAGAGVSVVLDVIADRFRASTVPSQRLAEAIEAALARGQGRMAVHLQADDGTDAGIWRYSDNFACADCGIDYEQPTPSLFSFNSPIGACEACRGFGRVIGVDLGLVIPDHGKSLAEGAVKPWQTASFKDCQLDLIKYGPKAGVDLDTPWSELPERARRWVIDGAEDWTGDWKRQWYGVNRFFEWLESKAYKMHIRVLLSRYRAYTPCTVCDGARLKPQALLWRLGSQGDAARALADDRSAGGCAGRTLPPLPSPGRGLVGRATAVAAGPVRPRHHAAADRAPAKPVRRYRLAGTAGRGNRTADHRNPRPAAVPVRCRARLPDP